MFLVEVDKKWNLAVSGLGLVELALKLKILNSHLKWSSETIFVNIFDEVSAAVC